MIKKQEKNSVDRKCQYSINFVCEARSATSLTAGVQGPLKGPGSSGYFRSSVVVSDAFLTPIFPGRSELLLCDFSFFLFNNMFKGK